MIAVPLPVVVGRGQDIDVAINRRRERVAAQITERGFGYRFE
jgi:hypothetical protein